MPMSESIAVLFPGQGSQYVGMGAGFSNGKYPQVDSLLKKANEILGYDLVSILKAGPEEKLKNTAITQPAIYTVSLATYQLLQDKDIMPIAYAGHSIGEYAAVVASGAISFEEGLQLVKIRGSLMEEASKDNPGAMAAIIGLNKDDVNDICREAGALGICEPVNYNCPGQIVIAGLNRAVNEAVTMAQAKGAKRAIRLNVQGPFHSSLMSEASKKLAVELAKVKFRDVDIPVVSNYDAKPATSGEAIKNNLVLQMAHPVLWEQTIHELISMGVEVFIEIGPGRVLSGLVKRIHDKCVALNVDEPSDLEKTFSALGVTV